MSEGIGPSWTTANVRTVTGEDHLGIKNVAIIIADRLQTGITSITPRARYWSFFSWVLHDFIQTQPERSLKQFKSFLKKREWYYILANIAEAKERGATTSQLMGVTKGEEVWAQPCEDMPYEDRYLQDGFGGYGVYRNVMKTVGLTREGDTANGIHIDRLTSTGRRLAEAFESTIENTSYYKEWRHHEGPIPREVLLEYGRAAALSRLHGSKDLPILRHVFLPVHAEEQTPERLRYESLSYYQYVIQTYAGSKLSYATWRYLMYDVFSPRGEDAEEVPARYERVAKGWEIYQGRQLFTYSLEAIWSYVLERMSRRPFSVYSLIDTLLDECQNEQPEMERNLEQLLGSFPLTRMEREEMVGAMGLKPQTAVTSLWNPLLVMVDVYHRFEERTDFSSFHREFLGLGGQDHLSLQRWIEDVNAYKQKSVREFLTFLLRVYVLQQHQEVAMNKILTTGNETYHFVENEGQLQFLAFDQPRFNVFRVNQALTILEDVGHIRWQEQRWVRVEEAAHAEQNEPS